MAGYWSKPVMWPWPKWRFILRSFFLYTQGCVGRTVVRVVAAHVTFSLLYHPVGHWSRSPPEDDRISKLCTNITVACLIFQVFFSSFLSFLGGQRGIMLICLHMMFLDVQFVWGADKSWSLFCSIFPFHLYEFLAWFLLLFQCCYCCCLSLCRFCTLLDFVLNWIVSDCCWLPLAMKMKGGV